MKKEFSTKDVLEITVVKRGTLRQWIDMGIVAPSIQQASGHGSSMTWSKTDVEKVRALKYLIKNGLSRKMAGYFINSARWFPGKYFVICCPSPLDE